MTTSGCCARGARAAAFCGDVDRVGLGALAVDRHARAACPASATGGWRRGGRRRRPPAAGSGPRLRSCRRQLGGRGRLAGALQADQHDDGRRLAWPSPAGAGLAQQLDQLVVDDLDHLLRRASGSGAPPAPMARSRTRATKSLTTLKLTSASSNARRTSFIASSTSASSSRPLLLDARGTRCSGDPKAFKHRLYLLVAVSYSGQWSVVSDMLCTVMQSIRTNHARPHLTAARLAVHSTSLTALSNSASTNCGRRTRRGRPAFRRCR